MADADLREPELAGDRCDGALVLGESPAVDQHDRDGVDPRTPTGLEARPDLIGIELAQDPTVGVDARVDLGDLLVEHAWQHDVAIEQARPVLVADPEGVAKSRGDREQ
ncbi:MAG: hypothetical protein R6W92_17310, partial [Desulfocurvibacter africanus]